MSRTKIGVELPCFTKDSFLNKEERFFSLRLMPEGTKIPEMGCDNHELLKSLKT